jgi:hypothetical protein
MSKLLATAHDQFAVSVIGAGMQGWGVNDVSGIIVVANGTSDTPANIQKDRIAAILAGQSAFGLSR